MVWLALGVVALAGIVVALALPSTLRPDCPLPGSGYRCQHTTEMRPWLRLLIGTVAVLPLVRRLGSRHQAGPWVAVALWALATAGAVLLIARRGLVASSGDCSGYPRCYTPGHPYIGVGAAMVLAAASAIAFWLWDKRTPSRTREDHPDIAS
jgi:hypothetical protein